MTVEFHSTGFSAVNEFFGNNQDDVTKGGTVGTANVNGVRGKKRGGVGTGISTSSSSSLSFSALKETVLKVGRKRRSRDGDEVENDDDGNDDQLHDGDDHDDDDDDDELAGGRTAIAEKFVTNKGSHIDQHRDSAKGNVRKPGKKERQRAKEMPPTGNSNKGNENQNGEPVQADMSLVGTIDSLPSSKRNGGNGNEHDGKNDQGVKEGSSSSTQRKRRKVRSRQKNIRKDNRSIQDKPAHLIPGTPLYQGRPLTPATRERLHPKSTSSCTTSSSLISRHTSSGPETNGNVRKIGRRKQGKLQTSTSTKKSLSPSSVPEVGYVIDREPGSNSGNDVGVKLAIDEFGTRD